MVLLAKGVFYVSLSIGNALLFQSASAPLSPASSRRRCAGRASFALPHATISLAACRIDQSGGLWRRTLGHREGTSGEPKVRNKNSAHL